LAWGVALMAAGTAANYHGQKKADKAIASVRTAEKDRQAGFKEQAESAFAQNQQALDFENVTQSMASKAAAREGAYQAVNAAAPRAAEQAAAGSMGGNRVVAGNLAAALGRASGNVNAAGRARAQLGAFGDAMFDASLLTRRGREGIAQAGDFASGSQRATEYELNAAQRRGDNAKALGALLTAIGGGVMGGAGAAAGGASAGAAGAGATTASTAGASNLAHWLVPIGASFVGPR
ncbi:MAG: hypothetical protein WCY29_18140, partial [Novosphingobium sp.]